MEGTTSVKLALACVQEPAGCETRSDVQPWRISEMIPSIPAGRRQQSVLDQSQHVSDTPLGRESRGQSTCTLPRQVQLECLHSNLRSPLPIPVRYKAVYQLDEELDHDQPGSLILRRHRGRGQGPGSLCGGLRNRGIGGTQRPVSTTQVFKLLLLAANLDLSQ
ncbi:hypothetical protein EYF80_058911 [Liparis tanakae]|uniref:Uncharacterized protein n=1 Tax=Liparis tanakae TaxID=230148 RepID=A0A4Z2EQ37_9TELE|nr:hypothetical protein EYF80_058911 [Liparis tanakae]